MANHTTSSEGRIHYFDMLKGIAIYMVVMGHVLTMCVREIDRAALFKFIGEIHMPLFFFISGWFTYRLTENGQVRLPSLWQRALQLLVPMAAVSTLWMVYFPHSGLESPLDMTFSGLWGDSWKNGYWFTGVLFEIMVIYWLSARWIASKGSPAGVQMGKMIVTWAVLLACSAIMPEKAAGYTSFNLTAMFFPVFMTGAIARCHSESFGRLAANKAVYTGILVTAPFVLYFICWPWEFKGITEAFPMSVDIARSVFHVMIAIIGIGIAKPWSEAAFAATATTFTRKAASLWELLGKKSLAIYLLHYFFLFPMGTWRGVLEDMNLAFTPLLAFSATAAAMIVAVTLGADAIIGQSPLLSLLLTGSIPDWLKANKKRHTAIAKETN